jgi:hypothetical protein
MSGYSRICGGADALVRPGSTPDEGVRGSKFQTFQIPDMEI